MKPPAFQFYADDFLGGTMNLTDAEVGLYIRLLCVQWSTGCIPPTDFEISSYGKGRTPIARVKAKFDVCNDGKLRNQRLEFERQKQAEWREKCASGGKTSAQLRAKGSSTTLATPLVLKSNTPVSGFQSPNPNLAPPSAGAGGPPNGEIRKSLLDTLASCDGSNPTEVTSSAWGAINKALNEILEVTPTLTPQEIKRRAANYRSQMKDAAISANALAKHWAKCDKGKKGHGKPMQVQLDEVPGWKTILNHEFPDSVYSAGQSNEAHEWEDLPAEAQQLCWQTYKKQGVA